MKFACSRWKRWAGCLVGRTNKVLWLRIWEQRLFVLQVAFHHLCFCTVSQLLNVPVRFVGATWESNFSIVPVYHLTTTTIYCCLWCGNPYYISRQKAFWIIVWVFNGVQPGIIFSYFGRRVWADQACYHVVRKRPKFRKCLLRNKSLRLPVLWTEIHFPDSTNDRYWWDLTNEPRLP